MSAPPLVYTARVTYAGLDRLDVTRKSAGAQGLPFAPSWKILQPMLRLRAEHGAAAIEQAWPQYVEDYTAEMRRSYVTQRQAWCDLLGRREVTLVCYCTDPDRCHRTVLAKILVKLGASYRGERGARGHVPRAGEDRCPTAADVEGVGHAILTRVLRADHPYFSGFVIASGEHVTLWPRPSALGPR